MNRAAPLLCRTTSWPQLAKAARGVLTLALLAWALLAPGRSLAQGAGVEPALTASSVKAAFLYKFLSYIELPGSLFSQADTPLVIGVAGADDVLSELGPILSGRTAQQRYLQARRVTEPGEISGAQVLFLGSQVDLARSPLVPAGRAARVLLVTDAADGLAAGGIINFLMVGSRVRFEVSLESAERASIKISSRVLGVAERVLGGRP